MKSLCSLPVGPEQIERAVELRRAVAQAGGLAVVERFIGTQRGLTRAERDLVLDWADNSVRGIFEVRGGQRGQVGQPGQAGQAAVIALNLVDDLDYVVYGLDPRPADGGFFAGTLLPLARDDSAWLAAGGETLYPPDDARPVARLAIDLATREPDLVFRNQEKAEQGWMYMRRDREEFVAFFGTDELVLPILEAEGRLNAYYKVRRDSALAARGRHRAVSEAGETTFVMPDGFFEFDTVGIIYDELDGFVVVPEYGMLRALFADPSLAEDREHANVLRAYLREDAIPPLPLTQDGGGLPRQRRSCLPARARQQKLPMDFERSRAAAEAQAGPLRVGADAGGGRAQRPGDGPVAGRALVGWRLEVRVELDEAVEQTHVGVADQGPLGRLAVQAGPGERPVEQRVDRRRLEGAVGRLDLEVAQRQRLDQQAAGQLQVIGRPGRVAQPQADLRHQIAEQRDHRLAATAAAPPRGRPRSAGAPRRCGSSRAWR